MSVAFRRLTAIDLPQIFDWLHHEHVKRWWRPKETYEAFVAEYLPAIDGREPTSNYLIIVDERPIGMIQTYLISDHPDYEELLRVGPGIAGVDLFIGEEAEIGRGLGVEVLRSFTSDVVFARPATTACVAGVEPDNHRSLRAFEKAGFTLVRDYVEEARPHRLLRLDRAG